MASRDSNESLNIDALGVKVKAQGADLKVPLLVVMAFGALGYMGWQHHESQTRDAQRMSEQLSELVYVMSLTQEDRNRLQLSMPDSLRRKVRTNP